MSHVHKKSILLAWAMTVLLWIGNYSSSLAAEPIIPEDLIIEDKFTPGLGSPVGEVLLVQGDVIIIHAEEGYGFWADKALPLYKGDTIVTQQTGRIRVKLIDESIIIIAPEAKLVINKSVYDPLRGTRSSFLRLPQGRARFWVRKLFTLKHSEFKVKTSTCHFGVRDSDFIVQATPTLTEVVALEDTVLEVWSLAFLEVMPVIVTDFKRTIIEEGVLPTEPEVVPPEEIERMKRDFIFPAESIEQEEKGKIEEEEAEEVPARPGIVRPVEGGILVSEDVLVIPEDPGTGEELIEPIISDIIEQQELTRQEEEIIEHQEEIEENIMEEITNPEVPQFPGPP